MRGMLGSLPEKQAMCLVMYHMEQLSIKEIAETLDIPENTVKSNLNYGRKKLKDKVLEFEKKGYAIRLSPIALLLFLGKEDAKAMERSGLTQRAGQRILQGIQQNSNYLQMAPLNTPPMPGQPVNMRPPHMVKKSFFNTVLGKVTVGVVSVGILGGATIGAVQIVRHAPNNTTQATTQAAQATTQPAQATTQATTQTTTQATTEAPQENIPQTLEDGDYADMIEGGLTKDELQFVLAYGPETITEDGVMSPDYIYMVNQICQAGEYMNYLSKSSGSNYESVYSRAQVNRYMSSFTDELITTAKSGQNGMTVTEDSVTFYPAELSYDASTTITGATYTDDEMKINYVFTKNSDDDGTSSVEKTATLKKKEDGKYQIKTIQNGTADLNQSAPATKAQTNQNTNENGNLRSLYEEVLQDVQNGKYTYQNSGTEYRYFVTDMDGDGIKELLVGPDVMYTKVFSLPWCRAFSAVKTSGGYELKVINGEEFIAPYETKDGNGVYSAEDTRGLRYTYVYRVTISGDTLVKNSEAELTYDAVVDGESAFYDNHNSISLFSIDDKTGLDNL